MKLPLHQILVGYLKEHKKVHSGQMEKVAQSWGYKGETGSRRMREVRQIEHHSYNPHVKAIYVNDCVVYLWKA